MATFQAVASSLGGLGTDIGTARLQDRADRLAEASLSQKWLMDKLANDYRNRQMNVSEKWQEAQTWRVVGSPVQDPVTKRWTQTFYNPLTDDTRTQDLPGPPEDSFESRMADMNKLIDLKDPSGRGIFTPQEAAAAVFRVSSLGKERPLDELAGFIQQAHELAKDPRYAAIIGKNPSAWALKMWEARHGTYGYFRTEHPEAWDNIRGRGGSTASTASLPLTVQRFLQLDPEYQRVANLIRQFETELVRWKTLDKSGQQAVNIQSILEPMYAKRDEAIRRAFTTAGIQPPSGTGPVSGVGSGPSDDLPQSIRTQLMQTLREGQHQRFANGKVYGKRGGVIIRLPNLEGPGGR